MCKCFRLPHGKLSPRLSHCNNQPHWCPLRLPQLWRFVSLLPSCALFPRTVLCGVWVLGLVLRVHAAMSRGTELHRSEPDWGSDSLGGFTVGTSTKTQAIILASAPESGNLGASPTYSLGARVMVAGRICHLGPIPWFTATSCPKSRRRAPTPESGPEPLPHHSGPSCSYFGPHNTLRTRN